MRKLSIVLSLVFAFGMGQFLTRVQAQGCPAPSFGAFSQFATGTHPEAVATGDLNGDGKPDMALANAGSSNVSVLINSGSGSFAAAVNYPVGEGPGSVAIGDLNGDGKADMAVANASADNVSVLINSGSGSFAAAVNYPSGDAPESVAVGDLNADGKLDLVVANRLSHNVSVLLNNGNGTFAAAVPYGTAKEPHSVAIGDVNGDGKLDLAVANFKDEPWTGNMVSVLINNGNGTFAAAANYLAGTNPNAVAIGDVDGDGMADLAIANRNSYDVSVLINNGSGTFGPIVNYEMGSLTLPSSIAMDDFNSDGQLDLAVATFYTNSVSVLLNKGAGAFSPVVNYKAGKETTAVAIGDLNGDGKADLITSNRFSSDVIVRLNKGNGTYAEGASWGTGWAPVSIALGDVNGDGNPDIATALEGPSSISIIFNSGTGTFPTYAFYAAGRLPSSLAMGDLNGDGKQDFAVTNGSLRTLSIHINTGTISGLGYFPNIVHYAAGSPSHVAIGDLNGDGKLDLAVASYDDNVYVLFNNGNGTFAAAVSYAAGDAPRSVAIGDLNGDGKKDLAVANYLDNNVSVLLNIGTGTFGAAVNYGTGNNPQSVAIGDLNEDGKADLAVANFSSRTVSVLLNNGSATFGGAVNYGTGSGPQSVAIGDMNGDGKEDLAVANYYDETTTVLMNTCTAPNYNAPPPSVVSIERRNPSAQYSKGNAVTYRVVFSESVTGVDINDFMLTAGGSVSAALTGVVAVLSYGTTFDVTVGSISGEGDLRLDLKSSNTGIVNESNVPLSGGFATGQVYTFDHTIPTLTSVGLTSNNANPQYAKVGDKVTVLFTSSEAIQTPTVIIHGQETTVTNVMGNQWKGEYTMKLTDIEGPIPFAVNVTDLAGNAGLQVTTTTNGSGVTFDRTAPSVQSIQRFNPSMQGTSSTTLVYRVTMSEGVNGVDIGDFTLTNVTGNAGTTNIAAVAPVSALVYDVTATVTTINGAEIRLDLNASGTGIKDAAGNIISGGFITGQTYILGVSPAITTCQGNITATTSATGCTSLLTFGSGIVVTGLPAPTLTYKIGNTVITSPHAFPSGVTIVDVTASNGVGTPANCSLTVTVTDIQAPVITQPADLSVPSSVNGCSASVNFSASATDNCSVTNKKFYLNYMTETPIEISSPHTFAIGSYLVTVEAKDAAGNTTKKTFTITVNDTQKPTVAAGTISGCFYNVASAEAAAIAATTYRDNCTQTADLRVTVSTSGTCAAVVTVTVTDASNNAHSVTYNTRIDNTAPVFAGLPGSSSVTVDCHQVPSVPTVTANDNCYGATTVTFTPTSTKGSNPALGTYYNYTITRKWETEDGCGNKRSFTQTITVQDVTRPSITCPAGQVSVPLDFGQLYATINIGSATALDNCTPVANIVVTNNSVIANYRFPVGATSIIWTATDPSGNAENCTQSISVRKRNTALSYTGEVNGSNQICVQYSDVINLQARLTDNEGAPLNNLSGRTVTFQLVNGNVVLRTKSVTTDASGIAADTLQIVQAPGSYSIKTIFAGDNTFNGSEDNDATIVKTEDALVNYNGSQYFTTASATTMTGPVIFMTSVNDVDDGTDRRGDIRKAKATFRDGGPSGPVLGTANNVVGLVNPSVFTEGLSSTPQNFTLSPSEADGGGKIFQVWVGASDHYLGIDAGPTPVILALPGQDHVSGAGNLLMSNGAGKYAGTAGTNMRFGFVMKWNKSGKNIRGQINIVYRKWELFKGVMQWRTYQMKSNAINSMSVRTENGYQKAVINTKATLNDITDAGAVVSYGGGHDLTLEAWDNATENGGSMDKIGVRLVNGSSELLFASSWSASTLQIQQISSGNVSVRNSTAPAPATREAGKTVAPELTQAEEVELQIKAYPNPTKGRFTVVVNTTDRQDQIQVRIVNINGRVMETNNRVVAGETLFFGDTYLPGTYFVEVAQGKVRKHVKMIRVSE